MFLVFRLAFSVPVLYPVCVSVAQNGASIPVRHAPGETDYNDGKKDDKRNHNGLVVVDPREKAREEGGFCGRHG